MARRTVTLYIDDTSIRLMVIDSKGVAQWAYSTLEPELVRDGIIINQEEVAARLRQLLDEKGVQEKRAVVGLSGLHSLTLSISLPRLPEPLVAEAVMREATRILPVPLDTLYVTWQRLPDLEKKIRAFAVAIPRTAADALLKTAARAGLTPYMMEIKPMALTRLVGEPNAVILDVQSTEYDIVIFGEGIPQPIRTVSFPTRDLSWQEKLRMIQDDLTRTMEFYDTKNPESPLVPGVPVYVSGELADEPEICQELSNHLGRSVMVLSLPARSPQGLSSNRHVVNVGLAAKVLPQKGRAVSMVSALDALPAAYQPKTFSMSRVLTLSGAGILAAMVLSQAAMLQINSAAISHATTRLETVNKIVEQKKGQSRQLTQSLVQAEADRDRFTSALNALGRQRSEFNSSLLTATGALPGGVSISTIGHEGSSLVVLVESASEAAVLTYARRLQNSGEFSKVAIARMQRKDAGMTFVIVLETEEQS